MTETADPQLQLKKRARRRLVGAVAFAGLAAVILPMVMDEEPKQPVQDVQIKIPGQDQVPPFKPGEPPARPTVAPTAKVDEAAPPDAPADKPPVDNSSSATTGKLPAAAAAAAVAGTAIAGKAVADKLAEKKAATPPAKANDQKSAEKKPLKPADKVLVPPAAKPRDTSKPAEKKPAPKKAGKPAETSPADETSRAGGDEAQRANALLSGKAPETGPSKSGGGQHLIMIGAFANPENAKQLQARLGAAGVHAYTEVLNSPDGKKTRVRAGPFANREAAEKALNKMKRIGVSGVVASRQ